jgi:hypothetical protein
MVRNAYQGFGSEYETLLSAFDKDIANQKKRVGKDRAASTLWAMERSRKDVADFIQSHYRRTDMSMLELTPEFIKDFAAYLSTERGLASGTIWQRCMWLKGVVLRAHYNGKIPRNPFAQFHISPKPIAVPRVVSSSSLIHPFPVRLRPNLGILNFTFIMVATPVLPSRGGAGVGFLLPSFEGVGEVLFLVLL